MHIWADKRVMKLISNWLGRAGLGRSPRTRTPLGLMGASATILALGWLEGTSQLITGLTGICLQILSWNALHKESNSVSTRDTESSETMLGGKARLVERDSDD